MLILHTTYHVDRKFQKFGKQSGKLIENNYLDANSWYARKKREMFYVWPVLFSD